MSLALSGLVSGAAKMRSSRSISAMVFSVSIPVYIKPIEQPGRNCDGATLVSLHKLDFGDACFASHRNNDSR
jgi:hypothetical protein